jgi:hypothetical protein
MGSPTTDTLVGAMEKAYVKFPGLETRAVRRVPHSEATARATGFPHIYASLTSISDSHSSDSSSNLTNQEIPMRLVLLVLAQDDGPRFHGPHILLHPAQPQLVDQLPPSLRTDKSTFRRAIVTNFLPSEILKLINIWKCLLLARSPLSLSTTTSHSLERGLTNSQNLFSSTAPIKFCKHHQRNLHHDET